MNWIFIALFLVCITFPIGQVEEHRFQNCYSRCYKRVARNKLLLSSDVCTDEILRYELDGDHVQCSTAQQQNDMGVTRCALTLWWEEGEISALYTRVFKSTMMIYAILLPCLLFGIYQIGSYYSEKRREDKWFSEKRSFMNKMIESTPVKRHHHKSKKVRVLRY